VKAAFHGEHWQTGKLSAHQPTAVAGGGGLLLALAVAGFVAICNATSSARLAARYPESGGTYVYGRERLGDFAGYLAGWCFVVGKTASCAAMALAIGAYVAPAWARPVGLAAVVALTAVNLLGVTKTAAVTRALSVQRFAGPEHEQLGDATGATIDLGGGIVLTWGEVVAIAGDEYGSVDELRQDLAAPGGPARLRGRLEHDRVHGPIPAALPAEGDHSTSRYIELAMQNVAHFAAGGTAIPTWRSYHEQALLLAVTSGMYGTDAEWQQAQLTEAFGQHFLTDSFSAGHVRTPRAAIMAWYQSDFAPRALGPFLTHARERVSRALADDLSRQMLAPHAAAQAEFDALLGAVLGLLDGVIREKFQDLFGLGISGAISGVLHDTDNERGIWVLSPTAAFATVVAEAALAMAIDLARGITAADRAFRAGAEKYGQAGNAGCFQFTEAPVGLIGFGDLGRALRALLVPFRNPVTVHDPWLPDELIRSHGCRPAPLDEVLSTSRVVFVLASVTTTNQGFLGKRELNLLQSGSVFLLMSRAAVVDFPELVRQTKSGRIKAAIDVFPEEPVPAGDPVRDVASDNLLLSAHRTGGMPEAMHLIGRMTVADAELILRGLPPQLCRRADPAVASRLRSKPVGLPRSS